MASLILTPEEIKVLTEVSIKVRRRDKVAEEMGLKTWEVTKLQRGAVIKLLKEIGIEVKVNEEDRPMWFKPNRKKKS